jgi:DNA-binding beta-propeller fold protein YncE
MLLRSAIARAAAVAMVGCTGFAVTPAAAAAESPVRTYSSPVCSTAAVTGPLLSRVRTAMVKVPGNPFGVVVTPDRRWAFVALDESVEVLRLSGSLAPVKVRDIAVNAPDGTLGETLTRNGRYLLVATGAGALVISVARAERGASGAVLGMLADTYHGSSAIEVTVSPDDRFAFVTEEYSDKADVFNLQRALTRGFGAADYVGSIPLSIAAVGMAVSPDGRWLYATSEVAPSAGGDTGTLSVISLRRAETDPKASVVATVKAGCEPVRVITSADGRLVWVTARASDDLLAFSAARLLTDPARALIAIVRVGEAPVGLMLVGHDSRVIVADSNRFGVSGATSDLDVINVAAALCGKAAVIGHIPAGLFPREMALVPGGRTLLVTNYLSNQVEAVRLVGAENLGPW